MHFHDDPYCRCSIDVLMLFAKNRHYGCYGVAAKFFAIFIFGLGNVFQIAVFFTHPINMDIITDTVPNLAVLLSCFIYTLISHIFSDVYEQLMVLMSNYSKKERSDVEVKLKRDREKTANQLVKFVIIMCGLGSLAMMSFPFMPNIQNLIIPQNATQEPVLLFAGEHFVDEQKFFYAILLYQYIILLLVITIVGSVECCLIILIYHVCGILDVIGYKIQNIPIYYGKNPINIDREVTSLIAECVEEHKELLRLVKLLEEPSSILLIMVLASTVVAFSVTLINVTDINSTDMKTVLYAVVQIGQYLLISLAGQLLVNETMKFPVQIYNAHWYKYSPRVQKLFLILLLKSYKYCGLSAANVYDLTLQNFGEVSKAAISYFMVLRQFR